jgi:hypothetical protein
VVDNPAVGEEAADISGAVTLTDKGRNFLIEKAGRYLGAPAAGTPGSVVAKVIEDLDSFATVNAGVDATTKDGIVVRLAVKVDANS